MRRTVLLLTIATTATACDNTEREPAVCGSDNTFVFNDAAYCIVIEEGFLSADCPDEYPEGRAFDEFVACTDAEAVPDDVEDEARRRGFGTPIDPECTDGDTRPAGDGCNTCECADGRWACTEMACGELEMCLAACEGECPDPAYQGCGVDGEDYCDDCVAACYGVELAPDRRGCDCPVPEGDPVEASIVVPMELCSERNPDGEAAVVATTNAEIEAWLDCPAGEYPTLTEGSEVLVRAVFPERPDASLTAAYADANTPPGHVLFLTAPQYCGGPAPSASILYVRLPADAATYTVATCTHTLCTEFFP